MHKERYERSKQELLTDKEINAKNRKVMAKFLEFQEYRLKRRNGLPEVDERSYKTLSYFVGRLRNLNVWLKNKDWTTLNKVSIKKLIDDLEDGVIKTKKGTRFVDRSLYYQMMQGKLFALIKKNHIVREIIEENSIVGRKDENQVRFITEDDFRKIVDCAISPEHRCLLWLAFDIGENIGSLLELEKKDFRRQVNEHTKEPEYLVILPKDKLKRSRTARSETTNYAETVKYLDIVLENLKPSIKVISNRFMKEKSMAELHNDDKLFKFGETAATLFLRRAVEKSGVRCQPEGQNVTWKDLRSSMACDLLNKKWTRDEINARLGHKPSSRIIDKYISFFALDRNIPKRKVYESNIQNLESELEEVKNREKLWMQRIRSIEENVQQMMKEQNGAIEKQRQLMPKKEMELLEKLNKEYGAEKVGKVVMQIAAKRRVAS